MMMNLPCLRGSCPNFLRTIYPTLSAGQAPKRSCTTVKTDASYSSCFLFDCYRPAFTCYGTDWFSGHCTTTISCWSFADTVRSGLHRLRGSVPEPCPVSDASHQPLDRVLGYMLLVYLCFLYCYRCLCFCRAFDIFQQFLRIISRHCLQDSVNHPQYLAGYHNQ